VPLKAALITWPVVDFLCHTQKALMCDTQDAVCICLLLACSSTAARAVFLQKQKGGPLAAFSSIIWKTISS
jgi:hypothetical protein